MDLRDRLAELAHIESPPTAVVSVYLKTRWADEHARDRARIFLKNELRQARDAGGRGAHASDLDWVETEAAKLIEQARFPDAHGVALFACQGISLREVLAVRVPFEDRVVIAAAPFLLPLTAVVEAAPASLVVFVDTEHARLVPIDATGPGTEVVLEAEVPGRHSRGEWAQLAQSRYQRHIQDHRDRHFDAVAQSLVSLADAHGVEHIVLAGEPRNVAVFRMSLPPRVAQKIAGTIEGARYEPAAAFVARASELVRHVEAQRQGDVLEAALTDAAKGGQAVAGVDDTLDAINRGAVHRLFLAKSFASPGHACTGCEALVAGTRADCRFCGRATSPVELEHAMSRRVLAAGGRVEVVDEHAGLTRAGGVAALLRYPR
ncbi:MAG: hypothetical protein ACM358_09665 [Gemmatimonadota bacterium]